MSSIREKVAPYQTKRRRGARIPNRYNLNHVPANCTRRCSAISTDVQLIYSACSSTALS